MTLNNILSTPLEEDKPQVVRSDSRRIPSMQEVTEVIGAERAAIVERFRALMMGGKYSEAKELYDGNDEARADIDVYAAVHKRIGRFGGI